MKKQIKLALTVLSFQFIFSCVFPTETCQEGLKRYEKDYSNMTLTVLGHNWGGNRTDYAGISLDTGEETRFKTNDPHYLDTSDYVEIGDTLIKNRGTSSILLLKKDSVIVFKFYCENDFTQTDLLSFKRPLSESDLNSIEEHKKP